MLRAALFIAMLGAQCPPDGPVMVAPDIQACGSAFVMEITGAVAGMRLAELDGTRVEQILPNGDKIEVTLDRVTGDAQPVCGRAVRIIARASVKVISNGCPSSSRATIIVGAGLDVAGKSGQPFQLTITPDPGAFAVTSDGPNAERVETAIQEIAPVIAEKLMVSLPLEGLESLAYARSRDAGPIQADAYQLGFAWVLRIYGPSGATASVPPPAFLQGDTFTLVLTGDSVRQLAENEFRAGHIPSRMDEHGVLDPKGGVRVVGVTADIEPDALTMAWEGVSEGSRKVDVRWRMAFVSSPDGLGLEIKQITVNGIEHPVPKGEVINPIDELIKSIATGPKRTALFTSPLGRMRLTTGVISADSIMVAGRV